jgi:hypothetical protein
MQNAGAKTISSCGVRSRNGKKQTKYSIQETGGRAREQSASKPAISIHSHCKASLLECVRFNAALQSIPPAKICHFFEGSRGSSCNRRHPGPTKEIDLKGQPNPRFARFFELACGKRPAEELYELASDPYEMTNLATRTEYQAAKNQLRAELGRWMKESGDPRVSGQLTTWDRPH